MIGLSFVFANGLALPFAFFYGVNDFYNDGTLIGTRCGRLKTGLYLPGAIYAISFVSLMVMTVLALIFFYGRIACTVFEHFKSKRSKKCSLNPLTKCSNNKYRLDIKDNAVDRHSHRKNVHQESASSICIKDNDINIIQQSDLTKIDRTKLEGNAYNIEGPCNELQRKPEMSIQAYMIEMTNDEEVFIELKKRHVITKNEQVDIESPSSEIEYESVKSGNEIVNGEIFFSEILKNVENTNIASNLWIELPDFKQNSEHSTESCTLETGYTFAKNSNREATVEKSNMNRGNLIQIFIQDIEDQSRDNPCANGITPRIDIRERNSDKINAELKTNSQTLPNSNLCLKVADEQSPNISSGSESHTDITNITPNETPMKKLSNNDHRNKRNRQFKNKFSMMFIVITSVSLFCYIPVGVIVLLEGVFPDFWDKLSSTEFIVVAWLYHTYIINSISNPIVYAFLDTEFYTGLKAHFARFCK
ncbi:Hypothetical predicted protein [Mytilus galloprovincialis]|uniref:G-protein coupled receptors family 1 profile domain-containing protein n=1 Tax=Mytilus galloprovincialis TaxID=29158 RepID=A0A8B6FJT1_MYTGA|nr:Hypothetical predicted protein [Mytilus galloprovincialis]